MTTQQRDADLVAAIDALMAADNHTLAVGVGGQDTDFKGVFAALSQLGDAATTETNGEVDYASLLADMPTDNAGQAMASQARPPNLDVLSKLLHPNLSDEERQILRSMFESSSLDEDDTKVVPRYTGPRMAPHPLSKYLFKPAAPKARGGDDYDDIETDGELEIDDVQPAKSLSQATVGPSSSLAKFANSHVDPNTAILLAGLDGAGCESSKDCLQDGPKGRLLNGYVTLLKDDEHSEDDDDDADAIAQLLMTGQAKPRSQVPPSRQRPASPQVNSSEHVPTKAKRELDYPQPQEQEDDEKDEEDDGAEDEFAALPDDSGSPERIAASGALGLASSLLSGLKSVTEEVEDTVFPMTLDPEFDYDANLFGFTDRFGELIRKEGRAVPVAISSAFEGARTAVEDNKRRHDYSGNARFASLFLDQSDPFATTAAPQNDKVMGTVSYSVPILTEDNQMIGTEEDETADENIRTENTAYESLVGGVNEANVDDEKMVQIIMKWAGEQ